MARAAQRDEQVIAQPLRKRDVPALPELRDVPGQVGLHEVQRDAEAEQQGRAARDIGVAREVEVDLKSKRQQGDPGVQ